MNHLGKLLWISSSDLQKKTKLTPGNLYSHCKILQDHNYIVKQKYLQNNKFTVGFRITKLGMEAFDKYLSELESFVTKMQFQLRGSFEDIASQLPPSVFIGTRDPEGFGINLVDFDDT